ncbi:MAG: bifunctional precorrin-2 dehydrogenase/sirohydrochlorin ferrochelatase [Oscillospiraceae bacterium]
MGYFPFFVDIKGKKCIVIGGGKVALRKILRLLPFGADITVVAPFVCSEIKSISGLKIYEREFCDSDLDGMFFAVTATDNSKLNQHIFRLCREKNILVNTVDDKEKCSFIFPALVTKNDITIGISTSGKSPVYAKKLKEKIAETVDFSSAQKVEIMGRYRDEIKEKISSEQLRKQTFEKIYTLLFESKNYSERDIENIIEDMKDKDEN